MKEKKRKLTNNAGAPVVDNQNSMTAGPRGPMLLQDVWFLEKLAHFDREVIPERRMHAKGSGAYGTADPERFAKIELNILKHLDDIRERMVFVGNLSKSQEDTGINDFSLAEKIGKSPSYIGHLKHLRNRIPHFKRRLKLVINHDYKRYSLKGIVSSA